MAAAASPGSGSAPRRGAIALLAAPFGVLSETLRCRLRNAERGPGASERPPSLSDIRAAIDAVDDQIVRLVAVRQRQVRAAAAHKTDEMAVRAPDRRAKVMDRVHQRALEHNADPEVVQRIWTAMIDAFIDLELREHGRHHERAERSPSDPLGS